MAAQGGVISLEQCLEIGLSKSASYGRVHSGHWQSILPRVFLGGSHAEGWEQRCAAACAWKPAGAITSLSAAYLAGITDSTPASVDLLIIGSPKSPEPWLTIHSTNVLPDTDVRAVGGLRVTSPERTLVELGGHLSVGRLEMMLDATLRERLSTLDRVSARVSELRTPGRGGTAVLSDLIDERRGDRRPVESALETLLRRLTKQGSLPAPVQQLVVMDDAGFVGRLDFSYPGKKLNIEADSLKHHLNRAAFEKDRARDARLVALGWRVLRFTYRQIVDEPDFVLRTIRAALELSP